ncbi:hypothetical protein K2O51_34525 (plasmid) [Cupriavidus pinatubonensis]|nr:hypothetical protein K2O51_34525 [Cupriavidus pinatubonensis]
MLAAVAWAPLSFSAPPASGPGRHAPEPRDDPAVAAQSNPDLDAQIAHLRAIREQLSQAEKPEERDMLIAEREKVMQDAMATVRKTSGVPGPGGMNPPRGTSPAQMGCYDMISQHMALMDEMMLATKGNQGGMGPGMGRGMGRGMGQGMGQSMGGGRVGK